MDFAFTYQFCRLKCHFDLMRSFSQRYNAIEELREGLETEANESSRNPAAYLDWLKSETDRAISTMTMSSAKDAITLVDISKQVSNQSIFNKYDFPPFVHVDTDK